MSTGILNKNWLNIKALPNDTWQGQIGVDGRGHAIFQAPAYSIRAGLRTLRTYQRNHGIVTYEGIFARWAPSSDTIGSIPGNDPNDPNEYAQYVASAVGDGRSSYMDLFAHDWTLRDHNRAFGIINAMVRFECGPEIEKHIDRIIVIKLGLSLYDRDFAPQKPTGGVIDTGNGFVAVGPARATVADAELDLQKISVS